VLRELREVRLPRAVLQAAHELAEHGGGGAIATQQLGAVAAAWGEG